MSRFVNRQATDEIVLANGDKVQIRQRLTASEDAELVRSLMRIKVDASTGEVTAQEGDWHLQRLEIVRHYLVGWDFKDDAGILVPFDAALIADLDSATIEAIAKAVDEAQKARAETNQKKERRS